MAWIAVGVAVLLIALVLLLRRRPRRAVEAQQLSPYHDGLDALTRLDQRYGPH